MSSSVDSKLASAFREHLPDLSSPRFATAKEQTPYEYVEAFQTSQFPPWIYNLTETWKGLLEEPYKGITNNGKVQEGLFVDQDLGVPQGRIRESAEALLEKLTTEEKAKVQYPLNVREWRAWSNPEFLLRPFGVRLEETTEEARTAVLHVIEATFSPEGYQKALAAMRINHFLGEVCQVRTIMNQYSYNFLLFGEPSETKPWGWSLYGHHLCLSVFLKGGNVIISPTFTGAEPNLIDDGPWKGTQILHKEGELGLRLMQNLPKETQKAAQTYELLRDPKMLQSGDLKVDRWNQDDQRHLCGAFRDNRVVPYEGVVVSSLATAQQGLILEIADEFLLYHPAQVREKRKEEIRSHFNQTYFSWIGCYGNDDPFYYRIQSPVIIFEFDHHSGVFLTNKEPLKFHTHTIVRTPNAGDYGQALRRSEEKVP